MPRARYFPNFPPTEEEVAVMRNMEVRPSTIPDAGNGVFTNVSIPKGKFLAYYRGKIVDLNKITNTDYVLALEDGTAICGKDKTHFGSMINCPTGTPNAANVEFSQDGTLHTIRAIKPGEELFVDYGREYWTGRPEILYDTVQKNTRKTRRARKSLNKN